VAKYLIITSDCEIGGHLHRNKDELFLILRGSAEVSLNGLLSFAGPGEVIEVPRNTFHSFKCTDRTEILCLASELHDPNDDIT
jgi:quercetin dioxygenase-like cupin family protein